MDREPEHDVPDRSVAAAACWELRLLGGVRARTGKRRVERWSSRTVAALLARLAMAPQREHAREEPIELPWPGDALAVGRNRPRRTLSTLRSLPEEERPSPMRLADRRVLRLAPGALNSDVNRFERALRGATPPAALVHDGGEPMPGFFDEWIVDERRRLQALAERLQARPAPAPAAGAAGSTLPAYLNRCSGTEPRAARQRRLVSTERLVSLVGPGGVGRPRLAVELAQALRDTPDLAAGDPAHPPLDAVVFVALADCHDSAAALDGLAQAVGAGDAASDGVARPQRQLQGQRALRVLDNVEQLLPDLAAPLAQRMAGTQALHLLLTTRRAAGLDGEHAFNLGPLPPAAIGIADAARNPAVALFVDRARVMRPDFRLHPRNVDLACELLALRDGLPLAIELAAARCRSLGPAEPCQRLLAPEQGGTGGTLPLLARGAPRGGPDPRHTSMEQVIACSWALLAPPVQRLLLAPTVVAGGFTAAAAAAVVDGVPDVAPALDGAVQHSLIAAEPGSCGAPRLPMGKPVRQFARVRLTGAEAARLRRRHRGARLAWARALPPTPPLAEVRAERVNVAAALAGANLDRVPGVRRQATRLPGRDAAARHWQEGEACAVADATCLMRRQFARGGAVR